MDVTGTPQVAVAFLDDTDLGPDAAARLGEYAFVVAGSRWNRQLLEEAGAPAVELVLQAVDQAHFHPGPRRGLMKDRFVVFTGGKLEYRKGQDLVLRAFRIFAARHRDALLLTGWGSPWPGLAASLAPCRGIEPPVLRADDTLDVRDWAARNGIDPAQVLDIGVVPNRAMPRILREADLAIFASRAEGGTNLVAMECMACGVPTVLSANTGHLDLLEADAAIPLTRQAALPGASRRGWGESDVDEMVALLEDAYDEPRRPAGARRARRRLHGDADLAAPDGEARRAGQSASLISQLGAGAPAAIMPLIMPWPGKPVSAPGRSPVASTRPSSSTPSIGGAREPAADAHPAHARRLERRERQQPLARAAEHVHRLRRDRGDHAADRVHVRQAGRVEAIRARLGEGREAADRVVEIGPAMQEILRPRGEHERMRRRPRGAHRGGDARDRVVEIMQRAGAIGRRILDRAAAEPGCRGVTHGRGAILRRRPVPVLEIGRDRQRGRAHDVGPVADRLRARHRRLAVPPPEHEGEPGRGAGERRETKRAKQARAARIPRIGDDEASALMQRPEPLGSFLDRHRALPQSCARR